MTRLKGTLFRDANLVGLGGPYCVKITAGRIESIARKIAPNPSWEEVDCCRPNGSLWLSPGLIDWHTHQNLNAVAAHRLDLQTAKSAADVFDRVRAALQLPTYDPKYGLNFVGVNMRNGDWPDGDRMNRDELDKISSTRPIFLLFNGYHSLVGNTIGLERYHVDLAKFPNGILAEQDAFAISHGLSDISDDTMDLWVKEQAQLAASLGVTEIVDLEMAFNIPNWQRRCAGGFDLLKVHIGFYEEHIDDAISRGLSTGDVIPGTNGLVLAGPYKIVTDGSLGSQTAFCHDVYPGTHNRGILSYEPPKLVDMIRKGSQHGYRMAVHAIGDEANDLTLEAIRQCAPIVPGSSIEHAQLLNFDSLPLFKSLDLVASIQPRHLVDDRQLCHRFWPGREARAYAFKSIVDAGIPIKLGSDAPVAPLQPWEAMAVAITRSSPEDPSPFCPEQRIDLQAAYTASTCNGQVHLQQGMSADLCILPRDPLLCDAQGLRSMAVLGTMLRGNWTWRNATML